MKFLVALVIISIAFGSYVKAQDVNLDYYLQAARINSPLLRDYRNALRATSIDSALIRANYRPQVSLNSTNIYAPANDQFGYDHTISNGGQIVALAGVNKTFVGRRNLATQFKAIGLGADSISAQAAMSEQDLIRTVTTQYLTAYGDQQQLLALNEISRLLANEAILLKNLTQNNIYRQTDYLTFLVTQKQQELQLRQMRIQYLTDFANLNYLCGIVDTDGLSKTLSLPQMNAQFFPDMLTSVFYRKYRIDSMRLANSVKLINLAYRPKLNVFADAGYSTATLPDFYHYFGASAGFTLSLPIYDGGKRKLVIRQVSLQEDTRIGYEDFFVKQYEQQLAGLRQQLSTTESLLQDIDDQITYSKGLIDVNEKLLQTGDAKISDFVIAVNNYLTAKTLLTQNRIGRLQLINQINYWNK